MDGSSKTLTAPAASSSTALARGDLAASRPAPSPSDFAAVLAHAPSSPLVPSSVMSDDDGSQAVHFFHSWHELTMVPTG